MAHLRRYKQPAWYIRGSSTRRQKRTATAIAYTDANRSTSDRHLSRCPCSDRTLRHTVGNPRRSDNDNRRRDADDSQTETRIEQGWKTLIRSDIPCVTHSRET